MNQNEPGTGPYAGLRTAGRVVSCVCRVLATPLEVILHGNLGPGYLGLHTALAMLLIPMWTVLWPHDDCRLLLAFFVLFLAACLIARLGICWRRLRGRLWHSQYTGTPRLGRLLPWLNEVQVKQFVEPVLVLVAGCLAIRFSPPLGSFLMTTALGLCASVWMAEAHHRRRAMDLHDAFLEQQALAESFRRMRAE